MTLGKRVAALLAPLATAVLVCASSGSGAPSYRGYVEAYLDNIPSAFVLDQPTPVTIKLHNASKIVLKHGYLVFAAQQDLVVDGTSTCQKFTDEIGGAACKWSVRYVKPGKTVTFKLSLMFRRQDFPNAIVPGTIGANKHTVIVSLYAQAPRLEPYDDHYIPVRISTG